MHPGMKLGPFTIREELGSGAMGAVYLANYVETGQAVAIKIMAPGIGKSETAVERFKREAAILKQLKHPNIVRLYATGSYKGTPFYAMEYIEGEPLNAVLARRGRLPWEDVVTLGEQLCRALQCAHDAGIIHRDLKPSNIMMLKDGTVKLTDFGIAKDIDMTGLTATNCTVGTAAYMSPEQCKGERDITARCDLYSMGVMFFELLTGKKPFVAEAVMEVFMLHVNAQPERPSRLVFDIPVWMDTLVCQLMEKKPDLRPYNASAVADSLLRIREKVEAQHSAGMDLASKRVIDQHPAQPVLEEEDRDVARSLLGKKKKAKKKTPIYAQGWFTILAVLMLFGLLGTFVYTMFIKPPSLEALYTAAEPVMKSNDPAAWRDVRNGDDGPLDRFLAHYADSDHPTARKLWEWVDKADLSWREAQMTTLFNGRRRPDGVTETEALEGYNLEQRGELEQARKLWDKLAALKKQQDRDLRGLGLVADKHLQSIDAAVTQYLALEKAVSADQHDKKFKGEPGYEEDAVKAIRLELQGKTAEAQSLWETVKGRAETNDAARTWYLIAAHRLARGGR